MAFVPSRPPSCLQAFVCRSVSPEQAGLPADVDFNSYVLECSCGHDIWSVRGRWFEDSSEFVGPLLAVCANCGQQQRLVDLSRDGYRGSIGDGIPEEGASESSWGCARCGSSVGQIAASVGYQYEMDPGEQAMRQDLFDAFILTHFCAKDGARVEIAAFDCA